MRIVGISMVKNGSDIIEAFVRHNLQYLDALFILDHQSYDGTRDILYNLEKEHLSVTTFFEERLEYAQSERINELCRKIFKLSEPDFVFVLDSDEFIESPGRHEIEQTLKRMPQDTFGLIPWRTYVYEKETAGCNVNPLLRIRKRRVMEIPQYYKVIVPKLYDTDDNYSIAKGNHYVSFKGQKSKHQIINDIKLAHFPVRSKDQITAKVLTGWLSSLYSNPAIGSTQISYHWREIYNKIVAQGNLSDEDFTQISKNYAYVSEEPIQTIYDPVEVSFPLNYTEGRGINALQAVTVLAENIIMSIHKEKNI